MATGEELDTYNFLDYLMWKLHLIIYIGIIDTSGFDNDLISKKRLIKL